MALNPNEEKLENVRMHSFLRKETAEPDSYLHAARQNLINAISQPGSFQAFLDAVADQRVERVLDVGCGIGQMLYPFVAFKGAFGVGIDPTDQACRIGHDFYRERGLSERVRFISAKAETLPFASASFDVVNCGLALPYMNNAGALDEIGRVLRPGGILLLKIHHTRYYLHDLWRGLRSRRLYAMVHAGRVLVVGAIYHLTGRQTSTRILGSETFQTRWLLRRELKSRGLNIESERHDTTPRAPAFVISKQQPAV